MRLRKAIKQNGGVKDFFVPVLFGCWLLYQFISSYMFQKSEFDSLGSDGYARIVSGVGLLLIILYLIRKMIDIVKTYRNCTDEVTEEAKIKVKSEKTSLIGKMREHYEISMLFLCIVYVILIGQIGFMISSGLYLLISMLLYSQKEKRNLKVIILLAILFSAGIYFIFSYGFNIILP
ncbi:tripartite tricarboxylate transporter TctB family protein [Mediterraneibacter agrestimuris]|uniref:tripartite tricarboxylate transporter TctB family protein n=1 Tax=Mediterraneibacter agrestimuris TaxID=2941333 RepID=UPI00203F2213|nr:tripartite tricarboxylate transporter TctB family protein [Mediterraneibacter agrestimuris]